MPTKKSDFASFNGHATVFDKDGQPISMARWGELNWTDGRVSDYARIGEDEVEGVRVSTVWVGLDHRFGREGPPLIFETMLFGYRDGLDGFTDGHDSRCVVRYASEEDARAGHERVVADLRAGRTPWFLE